MNSKTLIAWQRRALGRNEFSFLKTVQRDPRVRVYLVGGFVRDLLLKRESKDVDFVVAGVAAKKLSAILSRHGAVSFVGRTFGVFKFVPKGKRGGEAFDIALPRIDLPKGKSGAYRDVTVKSRADLPIEEDLRRRDFTINALAWSLKEKQLIDLGQGLADLKRKKIRTVGNPETRFREDFSRLLRGLRFATTLDFSFDAATWHATKKLIRHVNDQRDAIDVVPRETIAKEFLKTFMADPVRALDLYDRSGALKVLIPEMEKMKTCPQPKPYHMEGSVWQHTKLALSRFTSPTYTRVFPESPDAELIMAALFHDLGKPYTLKTPQKHGVDRIRFDGHDVVGGRMTKAIVERLKLSSMPSESNLHINAEHLDWLISHHLLLLHDAARQMKLTTIERYFLTHPLGKKLQQLILADSLATIPKSGRPYLTHLRTLWRTLDQIRVLGNRVAPPPSLLSGNEIMTILNIPSGPNVGLLLRRLREQQLLRVVKTKMQAKAFIKKEYGR